MRAHKNPTGRLAGTPTVVLLLWVSCMLLIKTAACKAACATVVAQCHSNDRKVHVLHCPVLTLLSLLYGCTHVYMDICTSGHFNLAPVTSASAIATRAMWGRPPKTPRNTATENSAELTQAVPSQVAVLWALIFAVLLCCSGIRGGKRTEEPTRTQWRELPGSYTLMLLLCVSCMLLMNVAAWLHVQQWLRNATTTDKRSMCFTLQC